MLPLKPHEMAGQALLLLSDYSSYMTGGEYFVDGLVFHPLYACPALICQTEDSSSGDSIQSLLVQGHNFPRTVFEIIVNYKALQTIRIVRSTQNRKGALKV
jgi:hypothetical protein